jgi:hypothetical protein
MPHAHVPKALPTSTDFEASRAARKGKSHAFTSGEKVRIKKNRFFPLTAAHCR